MNTLNLQLYGPCDQDIGMLPKINDTVAILREDGRVSLLTVTKVEVSIRGTDIWAGAGERFLPSDCYLVYTVDKESV